MIIISPDLFVSQKNVPRIARHQDTSYDNQKQLDCSPADLWAPRDAGWTPGWKIRSKVGPPLTNLRSVGGFITPNVTMVYGTYNIL